MDDPSLVFNGLIGCENIKTRLAEYQAVIEAANKAGRNPVDDLALTFCFQVGFRNFTRQNGNFADTI